MKLTDVLAGVKKEVDQGLREFFFKKKQEAQRISPHCIALVDQVAAITLRAGKRTRAFLVWLGHHSVIARSPSEARGTRQSLEIASPSKWTRNDMELRAMLAIELFQSFALIHDDIIDEDTVRRGGPTVHEYFRVESLKFKVKSARHFGESMAILAGDLALAWADELMGEVVIARNEVTKQSHTDIGVWRLYQKMKEEVIFGQSLDVLATAGLPSADQATINRYKTAWYTVIRPLQIGAAIGGADEEVIEAFVPYGLAVGEAYQLRDDFLDGAISQEEFQKSVKKLVIPKSATILLTDFARFVLTRQS